MQRQLERIYSGPETEQAVDFQLAAPGAFQPVEIGEKADNDAGKQHNPAV